MSGQTMSYSEQQQMVDDYVERVHLYETPEPLGIDLHAYAQYLEDHHIRNEDITVEMVEQFRTQ